VIVIIGMLIPFSTIKENLFLEGFLIAMGNKLIVVTTIFVLMLSFLPETDQAETSEKVNSIAVSRMKAYKDKCLKRRDDNQAYLIISRIREIADRIFADDKAMQVCR
jgi:hypothetical protein